jgi:BirA family biotin operon repressor/biotin-[acetyl-CoA-carboxylase] ligase
MSTRHSLLSALSDGQFHSGTALGDQLGVSRAAVNKAIQGLIDRGLEIHSVSGKGYRWITPTGLLNRELIESRLQGLAVRNVPGIIVVDEIESTSSYLLDRMSQDLLVSEVCLTEHQTNGRGRRGRQWISSPYQNLTMSISWRYDTGPSRLSGLSIAVGIAIVRALRSVGVEGVELKWPNDVLHGGRKLAGILVDLRGEVDGPTHIVVGVGLNVRLHADTSGAIDQAWTDLSSITSKSIDRNEIAALLIHELGKVLADYSTEGLNPYLQEWKKWHAFENKKVRIIQNEREISGTVCGLDESGALQLDTGEKMIKVHSGEVSLRAG